MNLRPLRPERSALNQAELHPDVSRESRHEIEGETIARAGNRINLEGGSPRDFSRPPYHSSAARFAARISLSCFFSQASRQALEQK